jgi:large subunit ribosomal protein L35
MPKKKTCKSAAKRVSKTASGRFSYAHAGAKHLMGSKSRKRKRSLKRVGILNKVESRRMQDLLPY